MTAQPNLLWFLLLALACINVLKWMFNAVYKLYAATLHLDVKVMARTMKMPTEMATRCKSALMQMAEPEFSCGKLKTPGHKDDGQGDKDADRDGHQVQVRADGIRDGLVDGIGGHVVQSGVF